MLNLINLRSAKLWKRDTQWIVCSRASGNFLLKLEYPQCQLLNIVVSKCWNYSGDTYCYCNSIGNWFWLLILIGCYLGSNVSISTNTVTPIP